MRWSETFTTILREKGIKIVYEIDGVEENIWVIKNENEKKILKEYIEQDEDDSFHELIRRNVITATRNYKNRFDAFIKNIIMDKSNPMCITHWSTKLEFQGRGAPHNHGVLWADLNSLEYMYEVSSSIVETSSVFSYNLRNLFLDKKNVEFKPIVIDALKQFYIRKLPLKQKHVDAITKLMKVNFEREDCNPLEILSGFKFFGLRQAFRKFVHP